MSVLLGNGNGTFAAKTDYAVEYGPGYVAIGDFNGDGKPDLVTANAFRSISVLLNNGNGTFKTRTNYALGSNAVFCCRRRFQRRWQT